MTDDLEARIRRLVPEDWEPENGWGEDAVTVADLHRLLWPDALQHWVHEGGRLRPRRNTEPTSPRKISRLRVAGGPVQVPDREASGWKYAAKEHIYLAWTVQSELLYVGRTIDPNKRLKTHRQRSAWWSETDHVELVPVYSGSEAYLVETTLIRQLQPIYNKQGNTEPTN